MACCVFNLFPTLTIVHRSSSFSFDFQKADFGSFEVLWYNCKLISYQPSHTTQSIGYNYMYDVSAPRRVFQGVFARKRFTMQIFEETKLKKNCFYKGKSLPFVYFFTLYFSMRANQVPCLYLYLYFSRMYLLRAANLFLEEFLQGWTNRETFTKVPQELCFLVCP
jgi:hypothetical protein